MEWLLTPNDGMVYIQAMTSFLSYDPTFCRASEFLENMTPCSRKTGWNRSPCGVHSPLPNTPHLSRKVLQVFSLSDPHCPLQSSRAPAEKSVCGRARARLAGQTPELVWLQRGLVLTHLGPVHLQLCWGGGFSPQIKVALPCPARSQGEK